MKTLDYVIEHIDEIEQDKMMDLRFTKRFLDFVPVEKWEDFGFKFTGEGEPVIKEWTEENVIEQLRKDVEFGIEKATNHRGISSALMYDVVKAWCIVLENGLENSEYDWYGCGMFKAVDEYYDFGLVDESTFGEEFYKEW